MRKQVSIFVAGAKALVNERNALKALSHELNTKYNEDGVDVFVEMKTYEEFKDNQQVYNEYIVNVADIAIFVLDGCIGDRTKDELIKAVEAYKNKQLPEIIVFLKHYDEETSEIGQVLDLLETLFGQDYYYVEYSDMDDLKTQTRTRIERIINPVQHIQGLKKSRWAIALLSAAVLILAGLLGWQTFRANALPTTTAATVEADSVQSDSIILFAGGGSVATFLEEELHVDLSDIPNSVFARMPSGNAWTLLSEEVTNPQIEHVKFYPVCVSATEAPESAFLTDISRSTFMERARIVSYYIGSEHPVVFISNSAYNKPSMQWLRERSQLSQQDLKKLLHQNNNADSIAVYTTKKNSGTAKIYQDFAHIDPTEYDKYNKYTENTFEIDFKPNYVILGSEYFMPKALKKRNNYKSFRLVDSQNGSEPQKKMYVYFVVPTLGYDSKIPPIIMDFLQNQLRIDTNTVAWPKIKNGTINSKGGESSIFYPLN